MSGNVELFTTRMRKATRKIHSISDTLVNAKFALSLRDETVWGGGLFAFYHVFAYLEEAKERLNMDEFNSLFVNKALYRKRAFEEDLAHYLGEEWRSLENSQALEKYMEHLQELERNDPRLLLAYVYHLYLGLLSGGQILAKKRRVFGEKNKDTYTDKVTDFSGYDISQLKTEFRLAMNEIAEKMSAEEQETFIEESNQVFLLNNTIVNAISGQNQAIRSILYRLSIIACFAVGVLVALRLR